jgi:hypothetical protein
MVTFDSLLLLILEESRILSERKDLFYCLDNTVFLELTDMLFIEFFIDAVL